MLVYATIPIMEHPLIEKYCHASELGWNEGLSESFNIVFRLESNVVVRNMY